MKKIVMVAAPIHAVPPRHGAAVEWWMYQVSRRLAGFERHIVCISTNDYPDEERRDGIFFHRIRMGRFYKRLFQKITRLDPWSYARRAAALIDRIKPDIVHIHNAPALFADLARHYRGPARFILHMHNEMLVPALPPGAVLFTVSDYLKKWYATRLPGVDIHLITNGVDTETFRPLPAPEIAALRARLQLPANRKIILYTGRMSPEKGPLDLVLAFGELLKHRQDVFLLLVGELRTGDDRRGEYGRRLLAACEALGDHCYHAGTVDPAHMHEYYQATDLAVVPSEFEEPFGMVAIEAMAAGAPVLAARRGGLVEFIREGETGFFIADTKNSSQFADEIAQLLDRPERLAEVARRARDHIERTHRWEHVALQLKQRYDGLFSANAISDEKGQP
jgi:glycosyltransferase involved in cell wall biosynthesis